MRRWVRLGGIASTCWMQPPCSGASASGNEAVSDAGLGDQMPRLGRVLLELGPELREEHAQVVRLLGHVGSAKLAEELLSPDHPPDIASEDLEDAPLGGGQPHLLAVAGHAAAREVDREGPGLDDGELTPGLDTAGRRASPREEFVHAERLDH